MYLFIFLMSFSCECAEHLKLNLPLCISHISVHLSLFPGHDEPKAKHEKKEREEKREKCEKLKVSLHTSHIFLCVKFVLFFACHSIKIKTNEYAAAGLK